MRRVRLFASCLVAASLLLAATATSAFAVAEPDDSIATCEELEILENVATRNNALSAGTDNDDIVAVWFWAGEEVSVSVQADPDTTDFGLRLFGDAYDIDVSTPIDKVDPEHFGGTGANPLTMTGRVKETGYYFVDVRTWVDGAENGGSGDYTLTVEIDRETTQTTIRRPKTLEYGDATTIYGHVYSWRGGMPSGNVTLFYSTDGINWIPLSETSLDPATGAYSFPAWESTEKTWYMATFEGTAGYAASSNSTYLNSTAAVGKVSSTRLSTRKYQMTGKLKPWHEAGTYPVRIYLWRKVDGKYKSYGYVKAYASNYSYYTSYRKTFTFPAKGYWRMRAYHSDSGHVASWSDYTYKSVY
ncbi:MAG TPA: hypothetical protein VLA05_05625 [Coriobacteriia bacterium]|nr:hypothetical protein [Coriobacteriia bacterium]